MATILSLRDDNNLWDAGLRTDTRWITKKKELPDNHNGKHLDYFDAVFLYSTAAIDLDAEQKAALIPFVKDDGKGVLAAHSAIEPSPDFPEYAEMIAGVFDRHPWNQDVGVEVLDRTFPATRHFPAHFMVTDEIYQCKDYFSEKVHELMKLGVSTVDLPNPQVHRTDRALAVAWEHNYGKGRVFCCSLGRYNEVWQRPDIQKIWLEEIKWPMGTTDSR